MYAIYFVCYGTSMLITYIIHLSLREPLQSHHHHHHHHHHQQQQQNQNDSEFCTESCSENNERPNEKTRQDTDTSDGGVDCTWSEWSQWSDCTVTCGQGVRLRHRTVLKSRFDNCSIDDSLQQEICSAQSPCHFEIRPLCSLAGNGILFSSYQFLFGGESVENPSQTSDDVNNMAPNEPDSFDGSSGGGDERLHNRPSHLPDAKPSRVVNEFKWSSQSDRFKPPPTGNEHQQQQQQQQSDDGGSQFCSSFDCSSPNTPEDKVPRFWGALNEEIREHEDDDVADQENHNRQHQQRQSGPENSKTDKENQKHEQKHHHRHEKHQSDDSHKNRRHHYQGRSSSFGGGSSGGEHPADDGSGVEDEKSDPRQHDDDVDDDDEFGQSDNEQHENHGNDDDDGDDGEGQKECFGDDDDGDDEPGESGGDDDFEDEEQWEASGDEENNDDDNDNRKEKRKRSIPEDEELDDKEDGEMDEEEIEEKGKTKRKKRKRRKRRKLLQVVSGRNLSSKVKNVAVNCSKNTDSLDSSAPQQPVSDTKHFDCTSEETGLMTPPVTDVQPSSDRTTVTDCIEYQNLRIISMETAAADSVAVKTTTETLTIS